MKTLRIVSSTGVPKTITTNADTWGELKQEQPDLLRGSNIKGIVVDTKVSLESDSAKLPMEGSIVIVPSKNKSGGSNDPLELTLNDLNAFPEDLFWEMAETYGVTRDSCSSRKEASEMILKTLASRNTGDADSNEDPSHDNELLKEMMSNTISNLKVAQNLFTEMIEAFQSNLNVLKNQQDESRAEWNKIISEFESKL